MTHREKLLQKIRNNPRQVSFADLDKLLLASGFVRRAPRSGSSHFIYTRAGHVLSVPYKRPHLGQTYVKQALQMLDLIEEEGIHGRTKDS